MNISMKKINTRLLLYEFLFVLALPFVHISTMPKVLDSLGRGTVIFFFLLSSYYYYFTINKEGYTYKDTLKRCLRLLVMEAVTYTIYLVAEASIVASYNGAPAMFTSFTWDNIVGFFRDYVPGITFLWFINALVICYLLMPLINKIKAIHNPKFVIVPFVILALVYGFRMIANHYDLGFFSDPIITRNFLLTGLPCSLIGFWINEHVVQKNKLQDLHYWFYLVLCIFLLGLSVLEAWIHRILDCGVNEFYIGSVLLAILMASYAFTHEENKVGDWFEKIFSAKGVTIIYLLHNLFVFIYLPLFPYPANLALTVLLVDLTCLLISFIYKCFYQLRRKNS